MSSKIQRGSLGNGLIGLWLVSAPIAAIFSAGISGFIAMGLLLCLWITGGCYFWAQFVSHTFSSLWYRYSLMAMYYVSTFLLVSCIYTLLK